MSIILNIILFILILGFIIFVHEFGHFTWAKICGVYVYEFALGMGPKLFGFTKGETDYSLRLIPIGGYCQLAGEDIDDDDKKKVPKNRRLQSKTCFQRFLIMFWGAGNNFLSAFIILFFIALIWGAAPLTPTITSVESGSAADKAGIEVGDVVTEVNGHKIKTTDDLALYLAIADPKKETKISVDRDGEDETYKVKAVKVKENGEERYKYGIGMQQEKEYGFVNSLKYMCGKSVSLFKQMFLTFGYLITGGIKLNQLSGPVGIYSVVGQTSKSGLASLLYLVAYLSINVGFINLLPLPAFDGGHILFIIIEKLRGKPVSPELENKIHAIGLILLLLLMVVVTVNDIIKLF